MDKTYSDTTNIKYVEQWKGRGLIPGVTGVILAGGASSRMGKNKALLKVGEQFLVERVYASIAALFHDVILVTNTADIYSFIPCPKVPDIYPGAGSIAGLHAGLNASGTERIFAVACDMPFLNAELIRLLCKDAEAYDAVVPVDRSGRLEPLHALYAKTSLGAMQESIELGDKSIINLLDRVTTRMVSNDLFQNIPGAEKSFRNLNTPEEYAEVAESMCRVHGAGR